MEKKEVSESKFIFVGNHRCLDFINTRIVDKGSPVDMLGDFSDLLNWMVQAQVLEEREANWELLKWNGKPEGKDVFQQALEFRAVLRNMVERIVQEKPVKQPTIEKINELLRHRLGYTQLTRLRSGFETLFYVESRNPIQLIVPLAESASDLLCHADFSLIKRCDNPDCILYFYDVSKNHARRWCSMNICGNRMKVAAHYRRHRDM
jgi:predicted RNA-binding Zn ribbon-like protein